MKLKGAQFLRLKAAVRIQLPHRYLELERCPPHEIQLNQKDPGFFKNTRDLLIIKLASNLSKDRENRPPEEL